MPNFKLKLDVTKLDKEAFFHGKNGAIYCDLVIWENRDGEDQWGNTHGVKQDFGKDKGPEKPPYVGNMKPIGGGKQQASQLPPGGGQRNNQGAPPSSYDDESDIPFSPLNPPLGI